MHNAYQFIKPSYQFVLPKYSLNNCADRLNMVIDY